MNTRNRKTNARVDRVEQLKEQWKKDNDKVTPAAGKTSQDILYGTQTENRRALGVGEYDE